MSIFPLLLIGGGTAALAIKDGATVEQTAIGGNAQAVQQNTSLGNKLATNGVTIGDLQANLSPAPGVTAPKAAILASIGKRLAAIGGTRFVSGLSVANQSNPIDPQIQQKLDEINKYGEAAYNQLSADARKAGAKALSDQLGLDPPLKGDESWKAIASVAGGAAGGAVGAYIGGPLGAKLGAMVGAYLGVKIEELLSKDLDKIGDWFKSQWGDIENWVKGEASDAENAVGNFLGSIF